MTKFKKLSRREKVEHIWEYYRYHIIGGIAGTLMLWSLLSTIFGPKPPEPAVNVVVMGIYGYDNEKIDDFKDEIANIIDEGEPGKVEVSMFPVSWDSASPMDMAMNQKLVLMFQSREVDVMIVEESKFDSLLMNMEEGIYLALDEESEVLGILEDHEDKLVRRKIEGEPKESVYGLYTEGNKKLDQLGLVGDYVVAVPKISEKQENALRTLKWLYEQ